MVVPYFSDAMSETSGRVRSLDPAAWFITGRLPTSSVDAILLCGISSWIWNALPLFGSRQKLGSVKRLEDVAATSDFATSAIVTPNWPARLRSTLTFNVG